MNRIITICAAILMTASMFAQSPEKMSYQAVVRDGSDALVTSTAVGMQISILQGTANGSAVYVETQTPTANANGLVSVEIGAGTTSDDFASIDWVNGPYFIKTETDPSGGTNYSITGTSQLMSVPYALYAKESGSSLPGPAGEDGEDGVGITSTTDNNDGTFTLNFSDGSVFTTADLIGPQGATGPTGSQGPIGAPGNDGIDGENGEDGVGITSTTDNNDGTFTLSFSDGSVFTTADLTGTQGATGATGSTGPQGPTGAPGNDGIDGQDGEDGVGITSTTDNNDGTYTLNFSDGSSYTTADLIGPQGAPGATGPTGTQGPTGAPGNDGIDGENGKDGVGITSTTDNNDGTFTLNFSDGSVFTTANLTGPQGATGPTGPQGPTGAPGNDGIDGENGEDGVGITSTTDNNDGTFTLSFSDGSVFTTANLTGPQGATGPTGPQGPIGAPGNDGIDGQDGEDGVGITETDPTVTKYSVGDFAQGGIVFWVDETGQHGLVAAKVDQDGGSGIQWYNGNDTDTEAHGDGVYAGEMKTMLIIANQGSNSNDYAAGVCANYMVELYHTVTVGGVTYESYNYYGDWYLPSFQELRLMHQNRVTINATAVANGGSSFASAFYWSSTEDITDNTFLNIGAFKKSFTVGVWDGTDKDSTSRVRAVRAF